MSGSSANSAANSRWALGLELVVELLDGAVLQLGDQRLDVQPGDERSEAARHPAELAQVGGERLGAPGYCTLTATSRPSLQRPRCTWPMEAAAAGTGSSSTSCSLPVRSELALEDGAHGHRRHRRRGVLQPGQLLAVGPGQLVGQRRLEDRHRLAELHRAALEVTQGAEQLLGGALLDLGEHRLGGGATDPLAQAPAPCGRRTPGAAPPACAVRATALRGSSLIGVLAGCSPCHLARVRAGILANCIHSPDRAATWCGPDGASSGPSRTVASRVVAGGRRRRARAGRAPPRPAPARPARAPRRRARTRPRVVARRRRSGRAPARGRGRSRPRWASMQRRQAVSPGTTNGPSTAPASTSAYDEMGHAVAARGGRSARGATSPADPTSTTSAFAGSSTTRVRPARESAAAVSKPTPAPRSSPEQAHPRGATPTCLLQHVLPGPGTPGGHQPLHGRCDAQVVQGRRAWLRAARPARCSVVRVRGRTTRRSSYRPTWRWCGPRRTTRSPGASWRCMRGNVGGRRGEVQPASTGPRLRAGPGQPGDERRRDPRGDPAVVGVSVASG